MKLRFLGQEYSPNNYQVKTIPSDIMVCYRGQSYPLRRSLQNFSPPLYLRKYRGILYIKFNWTNVI